jgi:hypothetical protein
MVLWALSAMSTYTRAPLLLRRTGDVLGTLEVQRLVHIDVLQQVTLGNTDSHPILSTITAEIKEISSSETSSSCCQSSNKCNSVFQIMRLVQVSDQRDSQISSPNSEAYHPPGHPPSRCMTTLLQTSTIYQFLPLICSYQFALCVVLAQGRRQH